MLQERPLLLPTAPPPASILPPRPQAKHRRYIESPRPRCGHQTPGLFLPIVVRHRSFTGIYIRRHYRVLRHNEWDRVVFSELVVVEGGGEALWGKEEWL